MGPKILIFSTRRPGMTLDEYKDYYENQHIPLLRRLLGDAFPVTHERNYIPRTPDGLAQVMVGQGDLEHDCITECTYADASHLERAVTRMNEPDKKTAREEDEVKFLDTEKIKILLVDNRSTTEDGG